MIRTVFVPLDGSPFGEQALPLASVYAEGLILSDPRLDNRLRERRPGAPPTSGSAVPPSGPGSRAPRRPRPPPAG